MPPRRPSRDREQAQATLTGLLTREKPLLLLMDGHALVHRAFHAFRDTPLTTRATGQEVRGVYGFMNSFLRALSQWNPTHCAIAFDMRAPTFRHREYAEYKAQRPESAPELQAQFPHVRRLMAAFNIPIYEMEGYEADDILGTLCRQAEQQQLDVVILTGDTDTLQLVSPYVRVSLHYSIQEQKTFDETAVRERYGGLEPTQQPDVKALEGDPSDNIPGVPNIGRKTAVKLIQQFSSIEGLYEKLDQVAPPRIQELLRNYREEALAGKRLTTIVKDMPIKLNLDAMRFGAFDRDKVLAVLRDLEFASLVNRIPAGTAAPGSSSAHPELVEGSDRTDANAQLSLLPSAEPETAERDYRLVNTAGALEALVSGLRAAGSFAFDTETTSLDPMRANLVGLSFSIKPGLAWYVPVGHTIQPAHPEQGRMEGPDSSSAHPELVEGSERAKGPDRTDANTQLSLGEVLEALKPILEDPSIAKSAHNANFDMTILANSGINVQGLAFDTMVAAHLVGHKALDLKGLAFQVLNQEMTHISQLIGTGKKQITFDRVPIQDALPYSAADADMTGRLRDALAPLVQQMGAQKLMSDMEMPLVPVLVQMQCNGILVDPERLRQMSATLAPQIQALEEEIYKQAGERFNLNSPQQLSTVLFEKLLPPAKLRELELPQPKRTKTGYSTDAAVLEELKGAHPVVDRMLEYRQLTKLKSTYLDPLPEKINPRTGRIHTSYNQVGSATGRLASSDPNLQNITIRTDQGREVRRAFVAQPGWSLLAADYSQIELRVLAHLSQDPGLLAAFHRGEDIHAAPASQVYGVALNQVTPDMRRTAKVMNFGIIYGLSAHGMAQQTDLTREQSAAFIEGYFAKYPGIRDYIEKTKQQARERGYVETVLGRRRYIPEVHHSNFQVRQAAERMAINMPVQGTAADLIKIAMIRIHARMQGKTVASRMLLQVHDELIFEVPPTEMDGMKAMVQELMPSALELTVPIKVALKLGPTWGDLE